MRSAKYRSLSARIVCGLALAGAALACAAQTRDPGERGSLPVGTARDGSAPAEGAIMGGSLEPDIRTSPAPKRDVERCKELTPKLREECLRDLNTPSPQKAKK